MRERILKIGKPEPLASIATIPKKVDANRPVVIILNSGVMHHVGTCRLSVKIARALAGIGMLSIRFDFSGIGDSATRSGTQSFLESAPLEVIEVMDHLQKTKNINNFVLLGLCSGADVAFETALRDERVCAMCQIDSYSYRTRKTFLYRWIPRLLSLSHWKRYIEIKKELAGAKKSTTAGTDDPELPSYTRDFPAREIVRDGLQQLANRGTKMFTIFTSEQDYYYKEQFAQSMSDVNFHGLHSAQYYPKCRHIITEPQYQKQAIEDITAWARGITRKDLSADEIAA